jgi:hypothetical protein
VDVRLAHLPHTHPRSRSWSWSRSTRASLFCRPVFLAQYSGFVR